MRGERMGSVFYILSVRHVFGSFYKGQLCSNARSVQLSAHKALSFQNTIWIQLKQEVLPDNLVIRDKNREGLDASISGLFFFINYILHLQNAP